MAYVSELISLFALVVSFLAFRNYSKFYDLSARQKDMEIELQRLSLVYNGETAIKNRSDSLKHHIEAYNEVYDEFCHIVRRLEAVAAKTHSRIYEHLRSCYIEVGGREVRHIYLSVLEECKRLYDPSLANSNGTYLINQLREIRWADGEDFVYPMDMKQSFIERIKSIFKQNDCPSHGPFQSLIHSPKFIENRAALDKAFPAREADELYSLVFPSVEEYIRIHAESLDELKNLEKRLVKSIKMNRSEEFSLEGLPKFIRSFDRLLRDIDKLSALTPNHTIPIPDDTRLGNALGCLIFAGSVVFFVSYIHLWGDTLPGYSFADRDYSI